MTDIRALCKELTDAVLSDDSHIDCAEIARRARAALASEPVPPVNGKVADPVIPGEYRGFNAIAYRNGFHAGHKHALTRTALAAEPEPEGPTGQDIDALHHAVFFSRLQGPPPNTSCEVDLVRAALVRWGQ